VYVPGRAAAGTLVHPVLFWREFPMQALLKAVVAGLLMVPGATSVPSGRSAVAIDDAAIVGIFDAANTWDISTGTLASKKASRQDVKDLGAMLARDHKQVQQQARDLAAKLGVKPTPVPADFALKKDYEATMKKLGSLKGAAFDKAFLEHEVAYHQAVIDAVKTTFLPAIKNAELKAFVEKVAPAFEAHRVAAANLLAKLQ
jgi:putative membrane protein